MTDLLDRLNRMMTQMKQDTTRAAAAHAQPKMQKSLSSMLDRSGAPDVRGATNAVPLKFVEVDQALKAYAPYHPLSLTYFEPSNASERFFWLQQLRLSFPIALIKVPIDRGMLGNFGMGCQA